MNYHYVLFVTLSTYPLLLVPMEDIELSNDSQNSNKASITISDNNKLNQVSVNVLLSFFKKNCSLGSLDNNNDPCTPSFIGYNHNKRDTILALVIKGIILGGAKMLIGSALPCINQNCCRYCKEEN